MPSYKPTFRERPLGTYTEHTSFKSLNPGSDAFVTEREMNEIQWIRGEELADVVRETTLSGVLYVSNDETLEGEFRVQDNDVHHHNQFSLAPFKAIVNGWMLDVRNYKHPTVGDDGSPVPSEQKLLVTLPNPPVYGVRYDFVFLECWLQELKLRDKTAKYGGLFNDDLGFQIIDERVDAETSRRLQLKWQIAVHEDYDPIYAQRGFTDADGNVNPKIVPLFGTSHPRGGVKYERVPRDPGLFRAGTGDWKDPTVQTADGYVYAIPLLVVTRINNSGYHDEYNPTGGVDHVDDSTDCDRPDGKYSNVVYFDQVLPVYHEATLGTAQLARVYTSLERYERDNQILRNKIAKLTYDLSNVDAVFRSFGLALPETHDLEVYGLDMYRQFCITAGASVDDDLTQVIYRRRRYSVGKQLQDKVYAVVPTLVDYDYERLGALGDVYVDKRPTGFYLFNTGARGLRMDVTAVGVDGVTVMMGEGSFFGVDGAVVDLGFTFNPDRHFVHILPLENANGRNGEVYVRFVGTEMIVYNTGLTTNKKSETVYTTQNRFQWVIIDTYADGLRFYNLLPVRLAGQAGRRVTNSSLGEEYRVMAGTPIVDAEKSIEPGTIGEVYVDPQGVNEVTVFNTGAAHDEAQVQCLAFSRAEYAEYYDVVGSETEVTDLAAIIDTPADALSRLDKTNAALEVLKQRFVEASAELSLTKSELRLLSAANYVVAKVAFTLDPNGEYTYDILTAYAAAETAMPAVSRAVTLLVADDDNASPTYTQLIKCPSPVATVTPNDDGTKVTVKNVSTRTREFVLTVR